MCYRTPQMAIKFFLLQKYYIHTMSASLLSLKTNLANYAEAISPYPDVHINIWDKR